MTLDNDWGSLTSQYFCGANCILAPLAPPRLSVPLNVDAEPHAAETNAPIPNPEFMIWDFKSEISEASIKL